MDTEFRYEFEGPLFIGVGKNLKTLVSESLKDTADFAQGKAREYSRVDTGRLRRGWDTRPVGWDAYLVRNFVPYVTVWEDRDGTLRNQLPGIQTYLENRLGEGISDTLN